MITASADLPGLQRDASRVRTVRDWTVPPNLATPGSVITIDPQSLDLLLPLVDRNTLFRHHWGYRPVLAAEPDAPSQRALARKHEWERMLVRELEPELQRLWRDAKREGWLRPSAAFGIFPVQADGDVLVVYDPLAFIDGARGTSLPVRARFSFPRQPDDGSPRNKGRLCLADYFRPIESGEYDTAGFQVVTAGEIASQTATRLQQADQYDRGFKVHGLAATVAEAMAEFIQQRIRVAMGVPKGQGLRYSWGYLACPNVSDQVKVLDLLPRATTELGISLTSGYQFDPDQTTAALVVHHPDAIYFAVLGGDTNTDELAV